MTPLLRKYAKALVKGGADGVMSGPRKSTSFLRASVEQFDDCSSTLMLIDVRARVPGQLREEMRTRLLALRARIDGMLDALNKVKE